MYWRPSILEHVNSLEHQVESLGQDHYFVFRLTELGSNEPLSILVLVWTKLNPSYKANLDENFCLFFVKYFFCYILKYTIFFVY